MKSVFVTGGAGFIGSHTCLLLLEKIHIVLYQTNLVNSFEESIDKISIILKDKGIEKKVKQGTSVLELINRFEKVNNVKVPFVFDERRFGDSEFVVADNSLCKINSQLDAKCKYR